jgi:hypothetical protein
MKTFLAKGLNVLTLLSLVFASSFVGPVKTATAVDLGSCETLTLISGNYVDEGGEMLFDYVHPNWTAEIDGAKWVWMGNADSFDFESEQTYTVENNFVFSGAASSAKLWIAADNGYIVRLNGKEIASDLDGHNYENVAYYGVDPTLVLSGENIIEFKITNDAQEGGTIETNPTGVLYKFEIECEELIVDPDPETCPALEPVNLKVYPQEGEITTIDLSAGQYKITASGTYKYRNPNLLADAAFSLRLSTDDLPEENYFEGTLWYQGNSGHLGIKVNGENPKDIWGSEFNKDHIYTYVLNHPGGDITFQITDDVYTDNEGYLNILIECYEEIVVVPVCLAPMMSQGGKGEMIKVSKKHPNWTNLSGAEWVWDKDPLPVFPDRQDGGVFEVVEEFEIIGAPLESEIKIAADNIYSVVVNGNVVYGDPSLNPSDIKEIESSESKFATISTHVIPVEYLEGGNNEVVIRAVNQEWKNVLGEGNINANPAGLIYGLTINIDGCEEEEIEVPVDPEVEILCEEDCEDIDNPDEEGGEQNGYGDDETTEPEDQITTSNQLTRSSGSVGGRITLGEVAGVSDSKPEEDGMVLGECVAFEKYHRKGDRGGEVARIQEFLNEYMNANLKVDGVYGDATVKAVHAFQQKYFDHVIKPWVPPLLSKTTGRWYKTTKMMANELINCPEPEVFLEDSGLMYKIKLENN